MNTTKPAAGGNAQALPEPKPVTLIKLVDQIGKFRSAITVANLVMGEFHDTVAHHSLPKEMADIFDALDWVIDGLSEAFTRAESMSQELLDAQNGRTST